MSDRDWKAYNAALVRRGEILLDLRVMKGWKDELADMNREKEGGRYEYPNSFIRLLAFIHVYLRLPYRQLEGFVLMLARHAGWLEGTGLLQYSLAYSAIGREAQRRFSLVRRRGCLSVGCDRHQGLQPR